MKTESKIIAFTPGEPAGIGPDLAVMIAQQQFDFTLVAIADPDLLKNRADTLGLDINIKTFDGSHSKPGELQVLPVKCPVVAQPGILNKANAQYVLETITKATQGCLNNEFDALVTGPIQKSIINEAGVAFTGHTEYLAQLCNNCVPVMMLANDQVKVTLVTTHLPLSNVSTAITAEKIKHVVNITASDLITKFGFKNPKIAVCGLNPHAGENGHLGNEEIDIIAPALEELKSSGVDLIGPLPADTVFTSKYLNEFDVVIAMYHDQGLPVVKALGFGQTVNVTLGLPIIRTSVDHGTALDLAATGQIDKGSLNAALNMAFEMAMHHTNR